jgi:hypothetical protein
LTSYAAQWCRALVADGTNASVGQRSVTSRHCGMKSKQNGKSDFKKTQKYRAASAAPATGSKYGPFLF